MLIEWLWHYFRVITRVAAAADTTSVGDSDAAACTGATARSPAPAASSSYAGN